MLKKSDRDRAVFALRNTQLPQGTGSLCRNGRYCALGVIAKEGNGLRVENLVFYPYDFLDNRGFDILAIFRKNDQGRLSLAEIADWLETIEVEDDTPDTVPSEWVKSLESVTI